MGGKTSDVHEGTLNRENFNVSLNKKVIEYLLNLKLKYEEEGIDLLVDLLNFCMNSLYGQSTIKAIDEEHIIRSEKIAREKQQ